MRAVIILLALPLISLAYRRGDVISTLVRSEKGPWRTPWVETLRSEMPHFREESATVLSPPVPHQATIDLKSASASSEPRKDVSPDFKISMAFSESRFVVPWVSTVAKGRGLSDSTKLSTLRHLKVTFLYSGSDILQVKWDGEYKTQAETEESRGWTLTTDAHNKGNSTRSANKQNQYNHDLVVKYEWLEVVEHDVESGLVLMFAATLLSVFVSLIFTCGRSEEAALATTTPEMGNRRAPPTAAAYSAGRGMGPERKLK